MHQKLMMHIELSPSLDYRDIILISRCLEGCSWCFKDLWSSLAPQAWLQSSKASSVIYRLLSMPILYVNFPSQLGIRSHVVHMLQGIARYKSPMRGLALV